MNKHSNISPVVQLAQRLYTEMPVAKPAWDQLEPYGATQQLWIERAEALMSLQA